MEEQKSQIFALKTTANREDQVVDFVSSNVKKKKLGVYSVIYPHGMRGYIFLEAASRIEAEQAVFRISKYAKGLLPKPIDYEEVEHMIEPAKKLELNIKKGDIVEIVGGTLKREQAKVSRIDKTKEEVVIELLEVAVPIPITLKMDHVKVIRRSGDHSEE